MELWPRLTKWTLASGPLDIEHSEIGQNRKKIGIENKDWIHFDGDNLVQLSEEGSPGLHPRSSLIPLFMSLSLVIHPSIHPLSYLASFEWSLFLLKLVRSIPFFLWSKNPYWYTGETCKVGELQSREFGERLAKSWLFITSCNASLMPLSIASAFRCWQQGGWSSHWCSAQSREICLYCPTSMARSYQITAYTSNLSTLNQLYSGVWVFTSPGSWGARVDFRVFGAVLFSCTGPTMYLQTVTTQFFTGNGWNT